MLHSKKIEVMSDTCLSGLSRTGKANAWGMGRFRWGVFFVSWMGNNGRLHHTVLPRLSEHGMLHICWCWPHWDHLLMSARPKKTWGGWGWGGAHAIKAHLYAGPVHIAVCSQTCLQLQNCTFCALFRPTAQQKVDSSLASSKKLFRAWWFVPGNVWLIINAPVLKGSQESIQQMTLLSSFHQANLSGRKK